ncbi:dihydrofolate reductase family protein [Allocoprobacillus halotolerans]|uniref:Dihydrofolate reductase family protein n=1 Tax=Allocoprobacillus halotolerans TaxID=2944914 RepID=A0ABY5I1K7_9FIRM|nr:dihydrofolate reductase family protein [Allocoprobacillus halotolerans]UTY39204.1 dihydrofolate reductase family protein [Allocoprobacillus halotolerans]
MTHLSLEHVVLTSEYIWTLVHRLKQEKGKDIWICSGQHFITPLIQANMIDEYHISMIPTLIGKGIRLFEDFDQEKDYH